MGKTSERLETYQTQMSIYAEQHKMILASDVLDMIEQLQDDLEDTVEIECHCKNCVHWTDMVAGATEHVKLCTIGGYMVGENGYCVYGEQALAEMKEV